jgi:hypothetical protein
LRPTIHRASLAGCPSQTGPVLTWAEFLLLTPVTAKTVGRVHIVTSRWTQNRRKRLNEARQCRKLYSLTGDAKGRMSEAVTRGRRLWR